MFVTTLEMDNFDCTKRMHVCKNSKLVLLIHEWKYALLIPPLPLMWVNNSWLCSTRNHCLALLCIQRSTNNKLRILVKAQPSTQSTGPRSPTRLGIRSQDLGLSTDSLGHCSISAVSTQKLAFTSITHYSQLLTLSRHCTKLLLCKTTEVDLTLSSKFRPTVV